MNSPVKKPSIAFLIFLLYTIPIAWFFFFVYTNSLNIPCGDDYKAILAFLNSFVRSASLSDKLNLIFSQYHEYRIGLCRIVTVLMYYIYGSINFKVLCVISNLSLIGIVYLFYKSFSSSSFKYLLFIPSVFLVFHMQYWEASLWSTAALQQIWVPFFALLCFYYLQHASWGYCLASFFAAACAAYTNGNGIICFIIGLIMLLISKQFAKSLSWSLAATIALYFYFYDYEFKTIQLPPLDETVIFILSFLGSAISFNNFYISLLFGCFSAIYIIYLTCTSYHQRNPVIYAMILFIVITALTVAISRSHIEKYQALASRYNLNSTLLMLCIYLSALEIILRNQHVSALAQDKKHMGYLLTPILALSICFCVISYISNLKNIAYRNQMMARAVYIWQEKGNAGYLSFPVIFRLNNSFFLKTFTESAHINAYELPANPHNDGDGIPYLDDNCPDTYNPFQEDLDGNGIGDACDHCKNIGNSDIDGDGIYDAKDNCCFVPNVGQEDADGDGIGDACDSSFIENHWLEAEQAVTIVNPLEVAADERASDNGYIYAPNGSGNQYTPGSAMAIYKVHIVKAGEYILWGRVSASDINSDSFFVQIDDGFDSLWAVEPGNDWHWDKVNDRGNFDPVIYTLARGEHTIKIKLREDGTRIDKLLLTNGIAAFAPSGAGGTAENASGPSAESSH
jgi:hypothetical protein